MTKIYAEPGTERWKKTGQHMLAALEERRKELRLPVLNQHRIPEPGVRIDVKAAEYGSYVYITGASQYYVLSSAVPAAYLLQGVNENQVNTIGPGPDFDFTSSADFTVTDDFGHSHVYSWSGLYDGADNSSRAINVPANNPAGFGFLPGQTVPTTIFGSGVNPLYIVTGSEVTLRTVITVSGSWISSPRPAQYGSYVAHQEFEGYYQQLITPAGGGYAFDSSAAALALLAEKVLPKNGQGGWDDHVLAGAPAGSSVEEGDSLSVVVFVPLPDSLADPGLFGVPAAARRYVRVYGVGTFRYEGGAFVGKRWRAVDQTVDLAYADGSIHPDAWPIVPGWYVNMLVKYTKLNTPGAKAAGKAQSTWLREPEPDTATSPGANLQRQILRKVIKACGI